MDVTSNNSVTVFINDHFYDAVKTWFRSGDNDENTLKKTDIDLCLTLIPKRQRHDPNPKTDIDLTLATTNIDPSLTLKQIYHPIIT